MVDAPESPGRRSRKPIYQNGVRTTGRAFHSPNWRVKRASSPSAPSPSADASSPGPRSTPNTNTSRLAFSKPSPHVPQAISEGRRLYVGNMPYTAKSEDVQALFTAAEFAIERIDIAIDPFTGRNPSYCFVDLETKDLAERAMNALDGNDMLGRPVKIKPGVVKSASERAQMQQSQSPQTSPRERSSLFGMDRWRRGESSATSTPVKSVSNNTGSGSSTGDASKRLYVGGLPKLTDQEAITSNMIDFFKDYTVENVSRQFAPHPAKRFEPGDHYYLFVDFSSAEEAENAMNALNRADGPWGAPIRVQRARGESSSQERRARWGGEAAAPAEEEVPVVGV
ncbi:ribonucleo protein [Aspergillus heteromorphus CBS 117.55]|uniref:Ribonucleo protein n=1 Tax=Aspergillus heteromorphus CBS 117.55 TaxID=1448321 RepID=A0A317WWE6_9EURO|nr:ribonucleo protein [Aspergillus heteromorphus CBS 117.55]PWY90643.1 ribonucleo protein [Aspergillus heteromorphus CBS 117.55]